MKRNRYFKTLLAAFSAAVCAIDVYSRIPLGSADPPYSMRAFVAAHQRRRKNKNR